MDFLEFRCIIPVAFNAVFTLSRLSFYGMQLLEQLSVASLSHPTVLLQCYSLLLLYSRANKMMMMMMVVVVVNVIILRYDLS